MTMRHSLAALTLGASFGAGCVHRAPATSNAGPPVLARIVPDSVALVAGDVTEVELRGSGFDPARQEPSNTVWIGRLQLTSVRANADGTSIRFALPDAVPSGGEAPPRAWSNGRYPVVVRTPRGTSDTVYLRISVQRGIAP